MLAKYKYIGSTIISRDKCKLKFTFMNTFRVDQIYLQ